MARDTLTGSRIRERRVMAGMKQADLARRVNISPSYLNLIEHNRRRIGGKLLLDIADELRVEPSLLTEGAEAALIASLREAAAEHRSIHAELDRVDEFAGRFPGWAELLSDARRRIAELERTVETLTDRLTHDPHLAASLHEVLSRVTAIRSTASILVDTDEIETEWRDRFHRNLNDDSRRLAESSQALVAYLDEAENEDADVGSPQEEVTAFFAAQEFSVPALEEGAAPATDSLPGATSLVSPQARQMASDVLDRLAEDARKMPLEDVLATLDPDAPDPVALAGRFGVDAATAMRRLALLPPGALSVAPGLVICDASGTITFRRPVQGFPLPRFGAACPLWPLYQSFGQPGVPIRQMVEQSGRDAGRFEAFAVALPKGSVTYNAPPLLEATMLLLPQARSEGDDKARPIGSTCRICDRDGCTGRREPSILSDAF